MKIRRESQSIQCQDTHSACCLTSRTRTQLESYTPISPRSNQPTRSVRASTSQYKPPSPFPIPTTLATMA
ncbi:hypothetical protein JAAARDRAFT_506332 [Jaapia argillacea MUCL 33604]|uniref:Uncharacterized protein n=1 Tax=Jaapia argillacea MUCL 33604 TaxID=933084 RepID=A0A067QFE9_9AGAM|nr:hypothetical protein JAAARDRAFT_506332 [Jaapia argillacea MUCL 33604]